MRERFHQGLDELRARLLAMGGMAEQAVERATTAYRNRDLKLCHAVLASENAINAVERSDGGNAWESNPPRTLFAPDLRI